MASPILGKIIRPSVFFRSGRAGVERENGRFGPRRQRLLRDDLAEVIGCKTATTPAIIHSSRDGLVDVVGLEFRHFRLTVGALQMLKVSSRSLVDISCSDDSESEEKSRPWAKRGDLVPRQPQPAHTDQSPFC